MTSRLRVPALVRQRAMSAGEPGRQWLDDLPGVLDTLTARWDLDLGEAFEGGTASYVAAATDGSGAACVIKVALSLSDDDEDAFRRSVLTHQLAAGRGCVALLDHDEAAGALLLERLGPNLHDQGADLPEILERVVRTLQAFWRPVPEEVALPTGADGATWLADLITSTWDDLQRPCPLAVIDRAVACCEDRAAAFDSASAVLVHGDAHGWNTLDAGDGSCRLVDPEGLRSERAHDLSVPMREYNHPLLAGDTPTLVRDRAERLATRCDLDPEPVWQWGYIERVSTGLSNLRHFDDGEGHAFLEVARRCV